MFGFFRRSAPRPLTDAIRQAIEQAGLPPAVSDPSRLRMVEVGGRYSDRKVTYFRMFDPSHAGQQTLDIRRYKDFDVFPALVLRSGHVEQDGKILLTRPIAILAARSAARTQAGRSVPALDETDGTGEAVTSGQPVTDAAATAQRA